MSGINLDGSQVRKGATSAVGAWVAERGGVVADEVQRIVDRIGQQGAPRGLPKIPTAPQWSAG
jgi:K+-transporting ATPase ATPase B chain